MQNQFTVVFVFSSSEFLSRCIWAHTLQDSELHRKIFKNVRPKLPLKFLEIKVDVTSFLISKPTLNSIPYLLVPSCKYFPEYTISFLRKCHNSNILSKNLSNYIKCLMNFSGIHMEAQKYLTNGPGVSGGKKSDILRPKISTSRSKYLCALIILDSSYGM